MSSSLTHPSSPTSLQLHFHHHHHRRPYPPPPSLRSPHPPRRTLLTTTHSSWNPPPSDSLSGWSPSSAEHGNGKGDPDNDRRFPGVLGAGLAGFFFIAGVSFAGLSLRNKSPSGKHLSMKPLETVTGEQLGSDDCNVKVDEDVYGKDNDIADNGEINETTDNLASSEGQRIETTDSGGGVDGDVIPSESDDNSSESLAAEENADTGSSGTRDLIVADDADVGTTNHVGPSSISSNVDSEVRSVVKPAALVSEGQDETGSMPEIPSVASTSDLLVLDPNETGSSEFEIIDVPDFGENNDSPPVEDLSSVLSELDEDVSDSLPERIFSNAGIPAPLLVSAAVQLPPGKILVPAVVDQVQQQTFAALQLLKVIEPDVQPGDLCTRREYSRWLVAASSALSRNTISKVYPAMYIENVTELAFDDITPEDPDFQYIQGLAEAGIISSKLSRADLDGEQQSTLLFSPDSPLSRQDLVSWKVALDKRLLPEVNRQDLYQCSGYIDIDKVNPDAWPALLTDLSAGEMSITSLAFGYTRLFQPNKPVTKAQAAIALATGDTTEVIGDELTRIEAELLAESAVNAHTDLVSQVEKDLNLSYQTELEKEREKIDAVERMAEEARLELEKLRAEREGENTFLIQGRATVESEMEVFSRLRYELQEQLQELLSSKIEISFEKDTIKKLREEAESENQKIVQLHYELEVERKALSLARAWAEEEAKRAREHARTLEVARDRWEKHGIKVVVDADLQDDASIGTTWLTAGEQQPVVETIDRAEGLVAKLRAMAAEIKVKSSNVIEKIIQKIVAFISALKQWAFEASKNGRDLVNAKISPSIEAFREKTSEFSSNASRSMEVIQNDASGFSSSVTDKAWRVVEDCKGGVNKISQRFKA